jgi:hypothetical protein
MLKNIRYLVLIFSAALICGPGFAASPPGYDEVVTGGGLVCPSVYNFKEAYQASAASDRKWLESLGCFYDEAGLPAIVIDPDAGPIQGTYVRARIKSRNGESVSAYTALSNIKTYVSLSGYASEDAAKKAIEAMQVKAEKSAKHYRSDFAPAAIRFVVEKMVPDKYRIFLGPIGLPIAANLCRQTLNSKSIPQCETSIPLYPFWDK